jgi:hypothetical protein
MHALEAGELTAIRRVAKAVGAEFVDGPGVRLRKLPGGFAKLGSLHLGPVV